MTCFRTKISQREPSPLTSPLTPECEMDMKIMVSACLLGQKCKYNGGDNYSDKVSECIKDYEVIPVCPEVEGGLPTPRTPCEIVDGIVTDRNGISRDREFKAGAELCLEKAMKEKVDLAILQSRSPSCGVNQIYDGSFSGKLKAGRGVFAEMLSEHGIKTIDAEDVISHGSKSELVEM